MADMTVLLNGLKDYQESLSRHVGQVRDEFLQAESRWNALNAVYEGAAADEFRQHWQQTIANFNLYIDGTQRIAEVLKGRIEALEEADRVGVL